MYCAKIMIFLLWLRRLRLLLRFIDLLLIETNSYYILIALPCLFWAEILVLRKASDLTFTTQRNSLCGVSGLLRFEKNREPALCRLTRKYTTIPEWSSLYICMLISSKISKYFLNSSLYSVYCLIIFSLSSFDNL